MSEYNQRQYNLMLQRLNAFEQGQLYLDTLVDDLEGLLNALEDIDTSWRQSFLKDWGVLEDIRAVMLDEGLKVLDERSQRKILDATARLKLMVLENIDDPADGFDRQ